MAAISYVNKLHNAEDPAQHFLVSKMIEGGRKLNQRVDTRQPITLSMLHKITASVPIILHDSFTINLFRAMFLLAFHAFLRVGEITVRSQAKLDDNTIRAEDCAVVFKNGQLTHINLTLRNSKHNKAKPFHISVPRGHGENCPATALHMYLKLALPKAGALFQLPDGSPVSRHLFQSQLKRCLQAAKINSSNIKTHSFRIGAATEAVTSLGLPDHEIQRLGRWGSNAFRSYIRVPSFTTPKP